MKAKCETCSSWLDQVSPRFVLEMAAEDAGVGETAGACSLLVVSKGHLHPDLVL